MYIELLLGMLRGNPSKAEKTYVLALDGYVEFNYDSLQKMVDVMEAADEQYVGAVCGRIHPKGSGTKTYFHH